MIKKMTKYTTVKAHRRRLSSGKVVNVKSHKRSVPIKEKIKFDLHYNEEDYSEFIENLNLHLFEQRVLRKDDIPSDVLLYNQLKLKEFYGEGEEEYAKFYGEEDYVKFYNGKMYIELNRGIWGRNKKEFEKKLKDLLENKIDYLTSWTDDYDIAKEFIHRGDYEGVVISAFIPIDKILLSYHGSDILDNRREQEYLIDINAIEENKYYINWY
jgi:hypothetical protein